MSGGWRWLAGGSRCLAGGRCDVWGSVPLRPLLNSRPHLLGGLWVLVRVVPLLGGAGCLLVGVFGLQFFSDGVGWSSGWPVLRVASWLGCSLREGRGCGSRCLSGSAVWLLRLFPGWGLRGLCLVSGGCSQACRVVPVGWADLDGRALPRPPSFSPHDTRRPAPGPRIRWANSHVKTLTDQRSSVSGTHTFRLYRTV